jgi:hypothetical protein
MQPSEDDIRYGLLLVLAARGFATLATAEKESLGSGFLAVWTAKRVD